MMVVVVMMITHVYIYGAEMDQEMDSPVVS